MYQPYSLPALPRHQCPFECLDLKRDKSGMRVVSKPCSNANDRKTGWCENHAYVLEMLEAAVVVGCPQLVIATAWNEKTEKNEPVLIVGSDIASWEAYATRHSSQHHKSVMEKLNAIKVKRDRENEQALRRGVENASIPVPEQPHVV
jgi:hypothetical protein